MVVSNNAKKRSFAGFWSISQAVHPCVLRYHCGGSASFCKVNGSAGFGVDSLVAAVVVDLAVQRLGGDDPRGRTPPLQGVRSFHTFLDLFSWAWFAVLRGVTYWGEETEIKENPNRKQKQSRKQHYKEDLTGEFRVVTHAEQNNRTKSHHAKAIRWQRHDMYIIYSSCHWNKGSDSVLCQKLLHWSNLCYLDCTLASNSRISIWHLRGFCNHSILYYL